jgi:hypothetical protein
MKQIKDLIREMVILEVEKITMGKNYRYKEEIMSAIQQSIVLRIDLVESQSEYQNVIDEEIEKFRGDVDLTLDMIARALYSIPYEAFKPKK